MAEEHNLKPRSITEEYNRGTYLEEHKSTWILGLSNISYIPRSRGTEEYNFFFKNAYFYLMCIT
jgi:hypothetical protein